MLATHHEELRVYINALQGAMDIFRKTKLFPEEERFSLTDQIRRSSRSICANIAEAWRKRRYRAAFIAKLSDAEGEAGETQVWLQIALQCKYIDEESYLSLRDQYDHILRQLILMIDSADSWVLKLEES